MKIHLIVFYCYENKSISRLYFTFRVVESLICCCFFFSFEKFEFRFINSANINMNKTMLVWGQYKIMKTKTNTYRLSEWTYIQL